MNQVQALYVICVSVIVFAESWSSSTLRASCYRSKWVSNQYLDKHWVFFLTISQSEWIVSQLLPLACLQKLNLIHLFVRSFAGHKNIVSDGNLNMNCDSELQASSVFFWHCSTAVSSCCCSLAPALITSLGAIPRYTTVATSPVNSYHIPSGGWIPYPSGYLFQSPMTSVSSVYMITDQWVVKKFLWYYTVYKSMIV